jgi:dTDP-4-dehydrorhamnose reductase
MTRILLLGKDGQLGRELQGSLLPLGQLVALGHGELDIACLEDLRATLRRLRPGLIVNAAAYTAVDRAEAEPEAAQAVNALAPPVLAEEAAALGAALVHYSTDFVFDGQATRPYTEDDPPCPLNAYGRSKLDGERAVRQVGGAFLVLRTSWVYGLGRESFVTKVLHWARGQRVLRVVEDQVGSPTWCRDLAEHTARILALGGHDVRGFIEERAGVYHLAGRGAVSRFDWAREILRLDPRREEQIAEQVLAAASADFPTPAVRPRYSALDCSRAERTFGLQMPRWQEALKAALSGPRLANGPGGGRDGRAARAATGSAPR